jgi:hypothetical protein
LNSFSTSALFSRIVLILLASIVLTGCETESSETTSSPLPAHPPEEEGAYFVDVTEYSGTSFQHSFGDQSLSNIVETVGSGAAFLDFDQDGHLDLYVANGAHIPGLSEGDVPEETPHNALFRNVGEGRFHEIARQAGVADESGFGMGVAVGDYDNDGFPDLFVGNYGPNVLFHNRGNGTFENVTERAGLAGDATTVGAVWIDFDNDGYLDLYVGNYLEYDPEYSFFYAPDGFPPPMAYPGQADVLYRNRGDGTFEDVTEQLGLYLPEGRMMGVGAADYDGDGYMDLYVANDAMANYLHRNLAGEGFEELGLLTGVAYSEGGEETSSMAVTFADYDLDGHVDLFVSDIHFSALYRNTGEGMFQDVTVPTGIAMASGQYDGWGASFFDYDRDGDADIVKVNGDMNHLFGQEDQVFENRLNQTFVDVSTDLGSYFTEEYVGRGACVGDYDNDGDVDVFIVNLGGSAVMLRNEGLDGNNWIEILLIGTNSNRDGVGARVSVTAGGSSQTLQKQSSSGYLSQNDPRLHFGLAQNEIVDRIDVVWPSGRAQSLERVPVNQLLTITESD